MKTLSIIAYVVGSILLIACCFTTGITLTWCVGGAAVIFLIIGCVMQFNSKTSQSRAGEHHKMQDTGHRVHFKDF